MLIRCDAPDLSFWLLALHAPHSGYPQQEREQWWEAISDLLRRHHDGDAIFVLGDTNAAPGNYDGVTVLKDGFSTSASTNMLKQFLTEFKLYLPATSEAHSGTNATWTDFQESENIALIMSPYRNNGGKMHWFLCAAGV